MADVCRSCKAPVLWAVTERGRPMPVDPDRVPNGNLNLLDDEHGGAPLAVVVKPDPAVERYVSHFATCPQRGDWRRR